MEEERKQRERLLQLPFHPSLVFTTVARQRCQVELGSLKKIRVWQITLNCISFALDRTWTVFGTKRRHLATLLSGEKIPAADCGVLISRVGARRHLREENQN